MGGQYGREKRNQYTQQIHINLSKVATGRDASLPEAFSWSCNSEVTKNNVFLWKNWFSFTSQSLQFCIDPIISLQITERQYRLIIIWKQIGSQAICVEYRETIANLKHDLSKFAQSIFSFLSGCKVWFNILHIKTELHKGRVLKGSILCK